MIRKPVKKRALKITVAKKTAVKKKATEKKVHVAKKATASQIRRSLHIGSKTTKTTRTVLEDLR